MLEELVRARLSDLRLASRQAAQRMEWAAAIARESTPRVAKRRPRCGPIRWLGLRGTRAAAR